LECILFKCWDTVGLKTIAGKNLLSRFDVISPDETIIKYIHSHEKVCSFQILGQLVLKQNEKFDKNTLAELNEMVNKDLALRSEALMSLNLNLDLELFYFGRPLFKILSQFSLIPREVNGKIILMQT
jgi:hypothetical protein